MDDYVRILALACRARTSWTSLIGVVVTWSHQGRSKEAWRRIEEQQQGGSTAVVHSFGDAGEEPPAEQETVTRLWIELPWRARSESRHPGYGTYPDLEHTVVIDGTTFWTYDPHGGAMTNNGDPNHQSGIDARLLDPVGLIVASSVEMLGEAHIAGRQGLRVLLTPRPKSVVTNNGFDAHHWHVGPREVVLDAERGVLLSDISLLDGEPFNRVEFAEIAFDVPIPAERLTFTPPAGEEVRNTQDAFSPRAPRPLHEVAAAAAFTVFAAAKVSEGWTLNVHHSEANERPAMPEMVHLHYASNDASAQITVNQQSEKGPETSDFAPHTGAWRRVARGGREYRLWEPGEEDWPMARQVVFEDKGTRVQLMGNGINIDALLSFAETFAPTSAHPPELG